MTLFNGIKHWTEDFVQERINDDGDTEFVFFNEEGKPIGSRDNQLMAQIALMDYCALFTPNYTNNPNDYLISMYKLMESYRSRFEAIQASQGAVIHEPE